MNVCVLSLSAYQYEECQMCNQLFLVGHSVDFLSANEINLQSEKLWMFFSRIVFSSPRLEAQKKSIRSKRGSRSWRTIIGLCGESLRRSLSHPARLTQMMWTFELVHQSSAPYEDLQGGGEKNLKKSPHDSVLFICLHIQKTCLCVLTQQYMSLVGIIYTYVAC